jgi:AraC-like DNA-binding protein
MLNTAMGKTKSSIFVKYVLLAIPGLMVFIPLLFQKPALVLFPSKEPYRLVVYSDKTDSTGKTVSKAELKDSLIHFSYNLAVDESFPQRDPYAGFAVELTKEEPFIDISKYDYVQIDLIIKHSNSFIVNLKTYIEGFTNIDDWHTYHIETIQVPVHFGSISYKIALADFKIPEWWWKEVGPIAANLPKNADRTKLFGIDFQNGSGAKKNVDDHIIIKKIKFYKNGKQEILWIIAIGLFILYISTVITVSVALRKKTVIPKSAELGYTKLDINNTATEEASRIKKFVGNNFQNPDLTVENVANEVGINTVRISSVLQKDCELTFKQYLNEIRITEAKRLLKETDRSITEIGFAVGYNNITHFNRVFKQETDKSPSEYREAKT